MLSHSSFLPNQSLETHHLLNQSQPQSKRAGIWMTNGMRKKKETKDSLPKALPQKKCLKVPLMPPTPVPRKFTSPSATNQDLRPRSISDANTQIPLVALSELKLKLEQKAKCKEWPFLMWTPQNHLWKYARAAESVSLQDEPTHGSRDGLFPTKITSSCFALWLRSSSLAAKPLRRLMLYWFASLGHSLAI